MSSQLSDFIHTWLEPGVKSKPALEPFERLFAKPETVETVFSARYRSTGLKPGVTGRTPQLRIHTLMRGVLASLSLLLLSAILCRAEDDAPFNSATISGLGARNIGSATMSGRISALAGSREPSGKITLFVAAASGGVWKSDDSGTRYRPVFDEQPVQSIGAIALDPKNSKNAWVGTGESWPRNSVSIGDGIYKSTDGGETWTHSGLEKSERIAKIAVSPKNSDTVFAAVPGALWSDSTD